MSATRRAILKLMGQSAAAAPVLASHMHAAVAKATMLGATTLPAGAAVAEALPVAVTSSTLKLLGKPVHKYFEKLRDRYADEVYEKKVLRIHGVDRDIAALRSLSPVTQARMQRARDRENEELMFNMKNILWPD